MFGVIITKFILQKKMSLKWINLPKFIQKLSVWDLNPILFEGKVCIFNHYVHGLPKSRHSASGELN